MTAARPTFGEFERAALAKGFDAVVERRWEPRTTLDAHSHPFTASALVVQGEMWLTENGNTRHLRPGDRFELAAGAPHSERYGEEGATYWVARKAATPGGALDY